MGIIAQNRVSVAVSSLPSVDWATASGGGRTHNSTKVRPAAGKKKVVLAGESEVENVTTTAFVDPEAHAEVLAALHAGQTFTGTTVSRVALDPDGVPTGTRLEWLDCSVAKFELNDADAN